MSSPTPSLDSFDSYEQWNPYDDISQQQTQTNDLKLCQFPDWDSEGTYDDDPPIYIHYAIVWKVTRNNRAVMGLDTVQDTVLAPAAYFQHFIRPNIDNYWREKDKPVRSEDTNVVVSVTQRKEPPLTKRFADTSIDWAVIEKQLVSWGEFYRAGKKLTLKLPFNYVDMLAEGALQLDAEQASSGRPSVWREVYNTMRCPGPPCKKGPHCWRDPIGKKHYPLNTRQLKSLIMHVQEGHTLETHNDVPANIREELYAEEQKLLEKHQKASGSGTSAAAPPAIHITNVLPPPSGPTSYRAFSAGTPAPDIPSHTPVDRLNIPGFRDDAVKEYCAWQQSQVKEPALKAGFQTACGVILKRGFDLELIRRNPNPKFLIDEDVQEGIAEHVISDIDYWFENIKRPRIGE
ncbi:uncharacterized protein PAC_04653 [Phialocephala subalpina]|uniref:Uncharacterized protein n=1 Tax=Phialocephala subalpina TaxID=576137 RepID=A0A1L7WPS5_9HELO|nr:uncharacterized protein PAC_04653 [Phialocephala subalpina]